MTLEGFRADIINRRLLICIFTGFASGLPLYILISLVPAWLRTEGTGLAEIGFFTLIQFPYTWKFLWSPLLDRFRLPLLGHRRGWMLLTQIALLLCIAALPLFNPTTQIWHIASLSAVIAFLSATQDIAIDAYRRELLPDNELGQGNGYHTSAYRISGLVPGSLALILADHLPWTEVFAITAIFMCIAIAMTLSINEPPRTAAPTTLRQAVVDPFVEYFQRLGAKTAVLTLCFMFLYKLGDNMATALSTPFYLDLGFSTTEIGVVAKHAALWPMVVGGVLGSIWIAKIGINKALWVFGVVQILSILGFAVLARVGDHLGVLGAVISFEYLGVGLGAAAFVAFIARTTSQLHTATQFALFTALAALPRTFANAVTGVIVESIGWELFFYLCTLLALPGMLLLFVVAPWNNSGDDTQETP